MGGHQNKSEQNIEVKDNIHAIYWDGDIAPVMTNKFFETLKLLLKI